MAMVLHIYAPAPQNKYQYPHTDINSMSKGINLHQAQYT